MQGGQQFKVDQAGLMKSGLIPVIVGAVGGLFWISVGLWGIAGLIGWLAPLFAGVWYVMTVRKGGSMPSQMDGIVNGGVLGGVVGLVYGVVALIVSGLALNSVGLGFLGISAFGVGDLIVRLIGGAIAGAVAAFVYMMLVNQGSIK